MTNCLQSLGLMLRSPVLLMTCSFNKVLAPFGFAMDVRGPLSVDYLPLRHGISIATRFL
jgi:hypothetical protein